MTNAKILSAVLSLTMISLLTDCIGARAVSQSNAGLESGSVTQTEMPEERQQPRAYHYSFSVVIDRPVTEVFNFITDSLSYYYSDLAKGHERFEVVGGGSMRQGSIIVCSERAEMEHVTHRYEVLEFEPNERLHYVSPETEVLIKTKKRDIEGSSSTYVYYDFAQVDEGSSRVDLTIIVQMPNNFLKMMGKLTRSERRWYDHAVEELGMLKVVVESRS